MSIAGFFEIDARVKSIFFHPHQRTKAFIRERIPFLSL